MTTTYVNMKKHGCSAAILLTKLWKIIFIDFFLVSSTLNPFIFILFAWLKIILFQYYTVEIRQFSYIMSELFQLLVVY